MASIPASEVPQILEAPTAPKGATLAQLAALHDETKETAHLAELLGRAPSAALALAALALVVAAMSFTQSAIPALIVWLLLVAAGIGAIARAYSHTIRAPFERVPLRAFSRDLSAILFYAGFAWGLGAFLALPVTASLLSTIVFAAGACVAMALVLRARDAALIFLAPVAGLSALAPLVRGQAAGLEVLVACGLAAGAIYAVDRLFAAPKGPEIAQIPIR
ncbi:MAG: hypothetical protein WBQ17_05545 [Rhizomicrobium sp.]